MGFITDKRKLKKKKKTLRRGCKIERPKNELQEVIVERVSEIAEVLIDIKKPDASEHQDTQVQLERGSPSAEIVNITSCQMQPEANHLIGKVRGGCDVKDVTSTKDSRLMPAAMKLERSTLAPLDISEIKNKSLQSLQNVKHTYTEAIKGLGTENLMDLIRRDRQRAYKNDCRRKELKQSLSAMPNPPQELVKEHDELKRCVTLHEFEKLVFPYIQNFYQLETLGNDEKQLINQYKQQFVPNYENTNFLFINVEDCDACGSNSTLYNEAENKAICETCGYVSHYIDTRVYTVFSDSSEFSCFTYKPMNHLNEFLCRFQAKENNYVPDNIVENLMKYLRDKKGIKKASEVTYHDVQASQRSLRQSRYYNQTMQIWSRITGNPPMRIRPDIEDKIRILFNQLKEPFKKHCPKNRKNFLSYPYTVYKLCQILGCTDILPYLNLLKGEDKLLMAEDIFKKICMELNWPFQPADMRHCGGGSA